VLESFVAAGKRKAVLLAEGGDPDVVLLNGYARSS
jgi:hypothetical protein